MGAGRILITGGAGFVGSHLADKLLARGYKVRALDNLCPQVHGPNASRPSYLDNEVELIVGDVRDANAVSCAASGVDAIFHFAATVGVGQSMYQIAEYTSVNGEGTAILLEALARQPVERLIVASSMSIYGEGLYRTPEGRRIAPEERSLEQLKAHDWEVRGSSGEVLAPLPTPESKVPHVPSVYAISKYQQERLCMTVGRAYGIDTVGLRFFNIYGTRQALSNPYTGVLAIFASRLLNNQAPLVNEDGQQQRDFVSVHDVADACILALEARGAPNQVFNIGSGRRYTINQIGEEMAQVLERPEIKPRIVGRCRLGDIRNCFADISRAQVALGYKPKVSFEDGLVELAEWLEGQTAIDHVDAAARELAERGLAV